MLTFPPKYSIFSEKIMKTSDYCMFYITAPEQKEAEKIASSLVENRLAACVSLVPEITSFFRWQGKIDTAKEWLLIGKSKPGLTDKIIEFVKEIHSYDVPEIIFLPINKGYKPYLNWIDENTK